MRNEHVFPAHGGWMYAVWIGTRCIVIGWRTTQIDAQREAALA